MPVNTVNVIDGPDIQVSGEYRGILEFVFHTGETIERSVRAYSFTEWNALPATLTPSVVEAMINFEIESHRGSLVNNIDPYFSAPFVKRTDFQHTTWDESFSNNIKYYLSLPVRLELLHIKETIDNISNTDLKAALGISQQQATQIRTDIQIAVDTEVSNDLYIPLFDEDGVLI